MVAAGLLGVAGAPVRGHPLGPPTLPLLAAAGILVGLVPAWVAPVERRSPAPGTRAARPVPDGRAGSQVAAATGATAPADGGGDTSAGERVA